MVFQPLSRLRLNQRAFSAFVMAAAVWAAPGLAGAMSRMGEAEVLRKDGRPCFALSAKEVARAPGVRVHAVMVSDESLKPVANVWEASIDPARTPTTLANCIVYGIAPVGADATRPVELKTGHVYEVYLNGRSSEPDNSTQGYVARFCFLIDARGGKNLLAVKPGSRAWREGVCK